MWIVEFEPGDPPRRVSPLVRVGVVLGGVLPVIGWGLLSFGMIFVWVFGSSSDLSSLWTFRGDLTTAPGVVVGPKGGYERSQQGVIVEWGYTFQTPDGQERRSASYSSDSLKVGDPVTVEYPAGRPEASRIVGMRAALFPAWLLLPLGILPGLMALLLGFGIRRRLRDLALLRRGRLAYGTLVGRQSTGATYNDEAVEALTFEFTADDGQTHKAVVETHQVAKFQDEGKEPLLYDPDDPDRAYLLDRLPGDGEVGPDGGFQATGHGPLLNLIAPGVFLVLNAIFALVFLGGG